MSYGSWVGDIQASVFQIRNTPPNTIFTVNYLEDNVFENVYFYRPNQNLN